MLEICTLRIVTINFEIPVDDGHAHHQIIDNNQPHLVKYLTSF